MQKSFKQALGEALSVSGRSLLSVAEEANVSYDQLKSLMQGKSKTTNVDDGVKVAAAFGVSVEDFFAGRLNAVEVLPPLDGSPDDRVEVYAYDVQASAGPGGYVDDYPEIADRLTFPRGYLRTITSAKPQNLAIIGVKGDSMVPTLQDDDVVLIDMSKTSLGYDGLFVLNIDGTIHVKRIARGSRKGMVSIISDNKARYPEKERDVADVHVIGKVIWKGTRE